MHMEKKDPDVCYIRRVCEVVDGKVYLLGIGPNAKWHSAPYTFALNQITRINFGGDYEGALHIVGGAGHLV